MPPPPTIFSASDLRASGVVPRAAQRARACMVPPYFWNTASISDWLIPRRLAAAETPARVSGVPCVASFACWITPSRLIPGNIFPAIVRIWLMSILFQLLYFGG